jgi:hypothetical protein
MVGDPSEGPACFEVSMWQQQKIQVDRIDDSALFEGKF